MDAGNNKPSPISNEISICSRDNSTMKKIMLIDDDATTNYLNGIIIEKSGLVDDVVIYDSAEVALSNLKTRNASKFLILLDVNMPTTNGWEFLIKFAEIKPRPNVHIVMLTSSINPHDKEKADRDSNVSEYRSKPLSVDVIKELVASYF